MERVGEYFRGTGLRYAWGYVDGATALADIRRVIGVVRSGSVVPAGMMLSAEAAERIGKTLGMGGPVVELYGLPVVVREGLVAGVVVVYGPGR